MKLLKHGLRFWITVSSVASFVGGWILLVHAPKPNQSASLNNAISSSAPTLEPLPPLNTFSGGDDNFSNQPFISVQPNVRSQFRPGFRTGGS